MVMKELVDPVDSAWELAQAANQAWDIATQPGQTEEYRDKHEMLVNMAGVLIDRESDNPFSVNGVHEETATDEQSEAAYARARSLLEHITDDRIIENLHTRHRVKQHLRTIFDAQGFVEVDTPILGTAVTEYTKDNFRVTGNAGEFFLPQSPQVYKQALVINTFPRYFQFARCFRDEQEEGRTDQLLEFTQIDIELRCENEAELRNYAEELVSELFARYGKECTRPFPIIDYDECMAKYGTDKPDLRTEDIENAFLWVVNFPQFVQNESGETVTTHHPFQMPEIDDISDISNKTFEIGSSTFDLVLNGVEIGGGDMRIHDYDIQREVFRVLGLEESQFAILLESLKNGQAPKHGGMAIGLDRITMAVTDTPNIKDVTAFNL